MSMYGDWYHKIKPMIQETLQKTDYYHGTGAYHYHYTISKYKDTEISKNVSYSFEQILMKGLFPQDDLFNEAFRTGVKKTISLSPHRLYSRFYAEIYFAENIELKYAYGTSKFWALGLAWRTYWGILVENIHKRKFDFFLHNNSSKNTANYKKMLTAWTRSFRADGKYENKNFFFVIGGKSDIPNNFGFILGIKKHMVFPIEIKYKNVDKDEVRVAEPIKPNAFSHIQVPLVKYDYVVSELARLNIQLPIIPIEFVEVFNYEEGSNY